MFRTKTTTDLRIGDAERCSGRAVQKSLSRDFWRRSIFDFCNKICQLTTWDIAKRRSYSITSAAVASSEGEIVETERLGGLEVDDEIVLGRRLHRQIARALRRAGCDRHSRPRRAIARPGRTRTTSARRRRRNNGTDRSRAGVAAPPIRLSKAAAIDVARMRQHDQTAVRCAGKSGYAALEVIGFADGDGGRPRRRATARPPRSRA